MASFSREQLSPGSPSSRTRIWRLVRKDSFVTVNSSQIFLSGKKSTIKYTKYYHKNLCFRLKICSLWKVFCCWIPVMRTPSSFMSAFETFKHTHCCGAKICIDHPSSFIFSKVSLIFPHYIATLGAMGGSGKNRQTRQEQVLKPKLSPQWTLLCR